MEPSHKMENIGTFLETHGVYVLEVMEAGLQGPPYKIKKRRPMFIADIMFVLHQAGYNILLPATWYHHQQVRLFIYYRGTLRRKDIRAPPNLTDLSLFSMEVRKSRERSPLLSCFYREHTRGVSGVIKIQSKESIS